MHLGLPHLTWSGPPIDDPEILEQLPANLAELLRSRNGCIAWLGGLHVRGASREPAWHSLRNAWEGPDALHELFDDVQPDDVPFAEDGLGDQFLLRDGAVLRLQAELGEILPEADSLEQFFQDLIENAPAHLPYDAILALRKDRRELEAGELMATFPPLCTAEAEKGVTLSAVPALERRRSLAELARQIRGLPDGATVRLKF